MPCYDAPRPKFWYMKRDYLELSADSLLKHHFEVETECEKLREWVKFVLPLLSALNINVPSPPPQSKEWENMFTYSKNKEFEDAIRAGKTINFPKE